MVEIITNFANWLEGLPPLSIYVVVFLISYLENLIPPVPGDVAIVVAGSLVGLGVLSLTPTIAIGTLGGGLGFCSVFLIGRRLGAAVHDPNRMRWIPRASVATVTGWLDRWGYVVVAANRFLAGGRAVIGLLAGASGLQTRFVTVLAFLSAFVWTSLLVLSGRWLGQEWETVTSWLQLYGKTVTTVLVVSIALLFIRQRMRNKASRAAAVRNREDTSRGAPAPRAPLTPPDAAP